MRQQQVFWPWVYNPKLIRKCYTVFTVNLCSNNKFIGDEFIKCYTAHSTNIGPIPVLKTVILMQLPVLIQRLKRGNHTKCCCRLVGFALQTCADSFYGNNNCQRMVLVSIGWRRSLITQFTFSLFLGHDGYNLDALMHFPV